MISQVLSPYFAPRTIYEKCGTDQNDLKFIGAKPSTAHDILLVLDILVVLGAVGLSMCSKQLGISFQAQQWIIGGTFVYSLFTIDTIQQRVRLFFNPHGTYIAPKRLMATPNPIIIDVSK